MSRAEVIVLAPVGEATPSIADANPIGLTGEMTSVGESACVRTCLDDEAGEQNVEFVEPIAFAEQILDLAEPHQVSEIDSAPTMRATPKDANNGKPINASSASDAAAPAPSS